MRKGKYLLTGCLIFAVDFDGTLVEDGHWPEVKPFKDTVRRLRILESLRLRGHKVILWTCRNGKALDYALRFLKEDYYVEFDAVNENIPEILALFEGKDSRKITADYYIDEAAGGFDKLEKLLTSEE